MEEFKEGYIFYYVKKDEKRKEDEWQNFFNAKRLIITKINKNSYSCKQYWRDYETKNIIFKKINNQLYFKFNRDRFNKDSFFKVYTEEKAKKIALEKTRELYKDKIKIIDEEINKLQKEKKQELDSLECFEKYFKEMIL